VIHKLRIVLPGNTYSGSLELDGQPMQGVSRISMNLDANALVEVQLTLLAEVIIEGEITEQEIVHVERMRPGVEDSFARVIHTGIAPCGPEIDGNRRIPESAEGKLEMMPVGVVEPEDDEFTKVHEFATCPCEKCRAARGPGEGVAK
jgi:hypothetical protein